jgi:hypothetical protein
MTRIPVLAFWFGAVSLGLNAVAHAVLVGAMSPYLTPDGQDPLSRVASQIFGRLMMAWLLGLLVTYGTLKATRRTVRLTCREGLTPVLLGFVPHAVFEPIRTWAFVHAVLRCDAGWGGCVSDTADVLTTFAPIAVVATIAGWLIATAALAATVIRSR